MGWGGVEWDGVGWGAAQAKCHSRSAVGGYIDAGYVIVHVNPRAQVRMFMPMFVYMLMFMCKFMCMFMSVLGIAASAKSTIYHIPHE